MSPMCPIRPIGPMQESAIRAEIRRLEAAYDEADAAGLKLVKLAAARALRWAVGDCDVSPSGTLGEP